MSTSDSEGPRTRSLVVEREVPAPPEAVWEILTTGEGLREWFPLDARVEPGVGGSIWLSWGPGVEAEAPIRVWEPPLRLGWEEDHGTDADGHPIKVAVDFHVEGREGTTVVRLVQSGISASADWDEMYDAVRDGWTYFLFNLAHYFLKHRGRHRKMVWRRVATDLARDAVWDRLVAAALVGIGGTGAEARLHLDGPIDGEVVSAREGYHFAAALPELDDSLLFVEIEGPSVGFWLSTYDVAEERVEQLRTALAARVEDALG